MKSSRKHRSIFNRSSMFILLILLLWSAKTLATPFPPGTIRWPAGATIHVWIQNIDPEGDNSRQKLIAEGIERWGNLLGRGYTIVIHFGEPPEGATNVVHFTWVDPGTSLPGDESPSPEEINGNDGLTECRTGADGNIASGAGILDNTLPTNSGLAREYIRNLGMHEFTHALGLADDPNGVVTNHLIQNDGEPMEANPTDVAEITQLYGAVAAPNLRPRANGQRRNQGGGTGQYTYDFTFDGQESEHVTIISLDIEPQLVTSVTVPDGWVYLDPDSPSSYDRTSPFYDDYMEDCIVVPVPDPVYNRIDSLIFRSTNPDAALTTIHPTVTFVIETEFDIVGTITCPAGDGILLLEGPVPPINVDAGSDIQTHSPYLTTAIDSTITVNGGGSVGILWTVLDQPDGSMVTFNDNTLEDPSVTFDTPGAYILRVTADDGDIEIFDDVIINVDAYPSLFSVIIGADDPNTAVMIIDGGPGDTEPSANVIRFEDVIPGTLQGTPVGWKASSTVIQTITEEGTELRGTICYYAHLGGPDPVVASVVFSSDQFAFSESDVSLRCHFDGDFVKVNPNDGSIAAPGQPLTAADAILQGYAEGEYFGSVDPPCKGIDCATSMPTLSDYHFDPPDFMISSKDVTSLSGKLTVHLGEAKGPDPVIPGPDGFFSAISAVISATVDPGLSPCGGIILQGDIDRNCKVDIHDLIILCMDWLNCVDPIGGSCP